jgi:hypothetical protein
VSQLAKYSTFEKLRDGCRVEVRALRPDDQAGLIAAVGRTSARSLQRRFFGLKRSFTDQEVAVFVNVDFVNHVALLALIHEGDQVGNCGRWTLYRRAPGTSRSRFGRA